MLHLKIAEKFDKNGVFLKASIFNRTLMKSQCDTLCTVCCIVNHSQQNQRNTPNTCVQTVVASFIVRVDTTFKKE